MESLFKALVKAQSEMKGVAKSANNPHFKSKYATLDGIIDMARPVLASHGLAIIQNTICNDVGAGVHTYIVHESGASFDCGDLVLPLGRTGGAQGAGSSITYARRYALSAALAISTEDDDDGNVAQKAKMNPETTAIRAELKKYAAKHGQDKAIEILKGMGVSKAADLPEGSLTAIKEACNE